MRATRLRLRAGRALPAAGLVAGAWAILPPYVGPELGVGRSVETVDHLLPGVCVVAFALFALTPAVRRWGSTMFLIGLGIALAGVWISATHVALIGRASRDEVSHLAAAHHSLPGLAIVCVGAAWALVYGAVDVGET